MMFVRSEAYQGHIVLPVKKIDGQQAIDVRLLLELGQDAGRIKEVRFLQQEILFLRVSDRAYWQVEVMRTIRDGSDVVAHKLEHALRGEFVLRPGR